MNSKETRVTGGFVLMLLIILSIALAASGNVIYVDANSPYEPGIGTYEEPFRNIQAGLNAALEGDTVLIRPGVYTGSGNYDLDPQGKSLVVSGTDPNDLDVINQTIVNPGAQGRGFYIHSGEDANCIIRGLTIQNAYTAEIGAGIYCEMSNPTITNCNLIDNHAEPEGYGGAVFCVESNSLFQNCVINGNTAFDGGGVSIRAGNPQFTNCIISNNHAGRYGGGLDCYYEGNPLITNCTITGNTIDSSGAGGAISLWGSEATVKNSILWANEATNGKQMYLHFNSGISVNYCNIQGGIPDVCVSNSDLIWGDGNMDTDPCFASFDPNGDPNLWDFHLLSQTGRWVADVYPAVDMTQDGFVNLSDFTILAGMWLQEGANLSADLDSNNTVDLFDLAIMLNSYLVSQPKGIWVQDEVTSPCINAGDPNDGWLNEPWPNGKRINIGAFGGTYQASKNGLIADFDVDGLVNFDDFSYLAAKWRLEQACIEDFNQNKVVDSYDLMEFCSNWLIQN